VTFAIAILPYNSKDRILVELSRLPDQDGARRVCRNQVQAVAIGVLGTNPDMCNGIPPSAEG
jgi:hypothetical protein